MPCLRVLHTGSEVLVIICDSKLMGKEYRQGELKLKVDESFYGGREASVAECLAALREATIANLVGSIVKYAVDEGMVNRTNIIKIQGVPHAQVVRM